MEQDTITRLRNAFAQVAIALVDEPASRSMPTSFPPPFSTMTAAEWRRAVELWRQHAAALLAPVPARGCPACGGAASRRLFESYDAHTFHECNVCGCWFTPKRVDAAVFDRLFERSPEALALARQMMDTRDETVMRDADLARIGGYLDDLLPLVAKAPRETAYLDIGCGVGHSLRAGQMRGARVQGIEADRIAVDLARAEGLPVAALGEAVAPGPYHLLSFWETLEHIADPLQALTDVLPLMATDGLVAITVPNLDAPATRTLREACSWVHGGHSTPGHVNLFHPQALTRLLARAGLTLIDADGQFSSNPVELIAFLRGATRGVSDELDPSLTPGTMPASLSDAVTVVWPGMALVERLALASPILRVIACRTGQEAAFAPAMEKRRADRRRQIAEEADALLAYEVDYKARAGALQQEVDDRDALLEQKVAALQSEIDRRDTLLEDKVMALQREVDLRDMLLDRERAKFKRTIEGQVVAGVHALGKLARGLGLRRG